jgi:sugar transferase (PEP-CTERM/EpsH1 system associated)
VIDLKQVPTGKTAVSAPGRENRPLVAHVIYQLAVGGMENGVVNLVNHIPADRYRHAIISLTNCTEFRHRIRNPAVKLIALQKREGKDLCAYARLWRLLRRMRPDILYTHSLATLDVQLYGALAGVPARIHGEHGQISAGVGARRLSTKLLRSAVRPLVHQYVTVNKDLANYLTATLGIPASRVAHVYNGVDTDRFHPRVDPIRRIGDAGFVSDDCIVIGTVGRMQEVKDQPTLVRAFLRLMSTVPDAKRRLRLVLIGDGPLRGRCASILDEGGAGELAWLPGEQQHIPELLRSMDIFVLPSISEGSSNTIIEAMASGLPVVATNVGGNPELVEVERTGMLVPSRDPEAMADAIRTYIPDSARRRAHGRAGWRLATAKFSLDTMIGRYMDLYEAALARRQFVTSE